ncbi:MAG: aminoglycoside phosphotransferase family protein [Planctomycetota bacterium]|nr:aminoglycoside phosphotransferase family protein [Planctomycetota bacterium]
MAEASTELDIEHPDALLAYLRAAGQIGPAETPTIRNLAGGVSNRTVLVERASGEGWVLKQALAKLRVKVDWFSDPARIHREAAGLRWLEKLAPPGTITPLVFEDHTHHLLAMQAVPMPHDNLKTLLLAGAPPRATLLDYAGQFGRLLGVVHRTARERQSEVEPVFTDRGFFESLRVEPYYEYTAAQVAAESPEGAAFLRGLVAKTRARTLTLVHGDYSPKNVLVREGRLILLDHEVIHWGDPAFDVGFALTHLLSKARHLVPRRADMGDAARAFWGAYREALGPAPWAGDIKAMAVMHTLGCLLARVAGRSPLEYLDEPARASQRTAVLALMTSPHGPPASVERLIALFPEQQ